MNSAGRKSSQWSTIVPNNLVPRTLGDNAVIGSMKVQDCGTVQVRPFSSAAEYEGMIDYFLKADDAFLRGMGVDRLRFPSRETWLRHVLQDHDQPDEKKDRLYVAWIYGGAQIGHSSVNQIKVGEEAYFHLHLWRQDLRKAGLGIQFCRESIALYFDRLACRDFGANLSQVIRLPTGPCKNWASSL